MLRSLALFLIGASLRGCEESNLYNPGPTLAAET